MSEFKFTPKKGVLSHIVATAKQAGNCAELVAKTSDVLVRSSFDVLDNLEKASLQTERELLKFYSVALGEPVTLNDIRNGTAAKKYRSLNNEDAKNYLLRSTVEKYQERVELARKMVELAREMVELKKEMEELTSTMSDEEKFFFRSFVNPKKISF